MLFLRACVGLPQACLAQPSRRKPINSRLWSCDIMKQCLSHTSCSMLGHALLGLVILHLVWAQPYPIPPTCYKKVLSMGKDITQRAAELKRHHDTWRCRAHLPDLYIDVHNACVMSAMGSYLSALDGLRHRRCGYTREAQYLRATISQLYFIVSQKCTGELVFTYDNCAALERGSTGT